MERCGWLRNWTVQACLTGLTCSTLFAVGCGSSDATTAAGPQTPAAQVAEAPEPLPTGNPADTVKAFLEAYKAGDPAKAEALLTKTALEETTKADLVVAPEGIETSNYTVGEFEIHEDGAQVFSEWTEVDETGKTKTDKIVWLLLPSEGQWKIAGMAMTVFEGEPPLILNFEDPEDMFRKQNLLA
ncbi:MAG TPA: nuclear transport factor 2 family protein, partial [Pirellulales bacterium]